MNTKEFILKIEEINAKISFFRTLPEVEPNSPLFDALTNVSYYLLTCERSDCLKSFDNCSEK